jgi:hypothetical protein
MKITHIKAHDKVRLINSVRTAAVAMANMWDELRKHETDTHEFDGTSDMLAVIACELDSPPDSSRISDESIWESLEDCWGKA